MAGLPPFALSVTSVRERRRTHTKGESISREYTDEGRSGFTLIRPALDQLREDARKPGCRCRVIRIYDKSRLARRAVLRHIVEDELEALGIRIEYIAVPIFDDTPEGQFAEGVTDQLDESMAAKIKQNLARGLDYHLRDGHVWWHPYGYRLDVVPGQKYPRVVMDDELRPIVREIFLRIIAGESAGLIARDLNRRGIPSPSVLRARARGKPDPQPGQWCDRTVCAMIRNPYYAGHAAYDRTERCPPAEPTKRYRNKEKSSWRRREPGEWYTTDVPAIVSDEEQAAALAALASGRQRSPRNSKSQYLLQGLLRCPACGRRLAAQRKDPGTPKERRYYRCSRLTQIPGTTRTARCRTRVRAADVEPLLVEHLAQCMENREEMRAAFQELRRTPERERGQWEAHLAALSAQQQRLERQRAGVYAMREAGETTAAQFAERRAAVEAELAAVCAVIAEVQGYLGEAHHQEALWVSLERFCEEMAGRLRESAGPEYFPQCQRVVQALVDAIDVYPDRFLVSGVFGGVIYQKGPSRPS